MNGGGPHPAAREIERVARESYGRLLAYLCARSRDLGAAEDALGDALVAALEHWPRNGVPAAPEAWLLTAARNALTDRGRHQRVMAMNAPALRLLRGPATPASLPPQFPDERLKLLFVCAHPELDSAMHAPLMLQTVLGLEAARIAPVFGVAPTAMSQRLVRAKRRILADGLRFAVPAEREYRSRVAAVRDAIYAAFGLGWENATEPAGSELAEEAIWLGQGLAQLLPDDGETHGLLALMLHCHARRDARRGAGGEYVPLSEQDPRLWLRSVLEQAEHELGLAARCSQIGRYQLEAAIQSAHAERAHGGPIEWGAIVQFYRQLLVLAPSLGARVGHAAAVAEANGPERGMATLAEIEAQLPQATGGYQPYWALRGHLLERLGQGGEAGRAFDRAIALAQDAAVKKYLQLRRETCRMKPA